MFWTNLKSVLPPICLEIKRFTKTNPSLPWLLVRMFVFRNKVILIRRKGNLGDVICTFPLVRHLRKHNPSAIILYECLPWNIDFPKLCKEVDLVIGEGTEFASFCSQRLIPNSIFNPLLSDEYSPPKPPTGLHIVEEMALSAGIEGLPEKSPRLHFPEKSVRHCKDMLSKSGLEIGKIAIIHMGPTWPVKEWNLEKWEGIVRLLKNELGIESIQVGAEFVSSSGGRPTPRIPGCHDWVGKISIEQTVALLSLARLSLGVDSGIMHLAGGVGIPTVGIFGPSSPELRLPIGNLCMGVRSKVPCLGCHHAEGGPLHWQTGCPNDIKCMAELAVDEVFSACKKVLKMADDHRQSSKN